MSYILPVDPKYPITDDYAAHLARRSVEPGVDWATPTGTPVSAIADGVIVGTGWGSGPGNYVWIEHDDGARSRYLHLSHVQVERGNVVTQGQTIGLSGNTGASRGPHLHMTFWRPYNWGGFTESDNFMRYINLKEGADIMSDDVRKILGGSLKNVPPEGNGPTVMDLLREIRNNTATIINQNERMANIWGGSYKNVPPRGTGDTAMTILRRIDKNTK